MNAPSTANASAFEAPAALPMPWVERIFQRLHGRFGNPFTDKFRVGKLDANGEDVGIVNAKTVWSEELVGYTPNELKRALSARYDFPPSLDEFQKAARPVVDLQALLHLAIREMSNRSNHQPEQWPDSRTFWAAQRIGRHDMLGLPAEKLQKRFELAWFEAYADKDKPIPVASDAAALPAPGKTTISNEEAKARLQQLGLQADKFGNERKWAFAIAGEPEKFPRASVQAAILALKSWSQAIPEALLERAVRLGMEKFLMKEGVVA